MDTFSFSYSTRSSSSTRGVTLTELLIVIMIGGFLAAVLVPVVGLRLGDAQNAQCRSNLRAIGAGIHLYAQDNENNTPDYHDVVATATVYVRDRLGGLLVAPPMGYGADYIDTTEVFFCPNQPNVQPGDGAHEYWSSAWGDPAMGYIWLYRQQEQDYLNTSQVREDNQHNVIVMDQGYEAWLNAYDFVTLPHGEELNVLRVGGYVTSVPLTVVNGTEYGTGISAMSRRMNEYRRHYAEWVKDHFNSGEIVEGLLTEPDADPAGDGVANLVKYALGLDPRRADRADLPALGKTEVGEDVYLTLTFTAPPSAADVEYAVRVSPDLGEWMDGAELESSETNDDGTVTRTYRDSEPLTEEGQRFMHLNVTLP